MAGMTVLVGVGVTVAVRQPIATPSPVSQRAARLPDAASSATSDPLTPSALTVTGESAVPGAPAASPSAEASPTAVSAPSLPAQSTASQKTADAKDPVASGQPCRPVRFTMGGLGIDASVVTLAVTAEGDLGTPSDANRTSAGWFPSVLAGADRGTVLMDGHTYHDGSAIFDTSFKDQVRAGMLMRLSCADGHAFSYRVSEIIVDLSPGTYPSLVKSRNLYAASGPAQLVMITCTDYIPAQRVWANRAVVIATPIA